MNLRDLSKHLDLSMTTVSRALNGYDDVAEATRARVRAAAAALGYTPNPTARRLASGRAELVGMVLPLQYGHFADPFFTELLVGIGERLHRASLDLVVTAAPAGGDEMQAYRRLVEGRRVDALIVGRSRLHDERISYLLDRGFPFVVHGRTEEARPYAFLDMDSRSGFRAAAGWLAGLGHRRIALVNAPSELMVTTVRRAGWQEGLGDAGLTADEGLLAEGDLSEDSGFRCGLALLGAADPPTAILAANDLMAAGVLRAARTLGRRVPEDLSVIGYDDLPLAAVTDPPLTTLSQPVRKAGEQLVEMLLDLIAGGSVERHRTIWLPRLITRGSHGPGPHARTGATNP
jgi:LacI family transcriptional regulator